jgi:hypothetical protein
LKAVVVSKMQIIVAGTVEVACLMPPARFWALVVAACVRHVGKVRA